MAEHSVEPQYDFGGATFDLNDPADREIVRFILSQALFGEATGVYCGRSLYAAQTLEAAQFYVRQARQELNHLQLFADIFRELDMKPLPAHWVIKLLSSQPSKIAGFQGRGTLRAGSEADIAVFDPTEKIKVDASRFKSRSRNTPFDGWVLKGKMKLTVVGGKIVYDER